MQQSPSSEENPSRPLPSSSPNYTVVVNGETVYNGPDSGQARVAYNRGLKNPNPTITYAIDGVVKYQYPVPR